MDTVVWPSWCYSDPSNSTEQLETSMSISKPLRKKRMERTTLNNSNSSSNNNNNNINNNNNNNNNGIPSAVSTNDNITIHNNNNVKTERLSPATLENSSSRSRSVTPSSASHSGTPPAPDNNLFSAHSQVKNYSEWIRNLAARYHQNNNPNDYFNTVTKNGFPPPPFIDPRYKITSGSHGAVSFHPAFLPNLSVTPTTKDIDTVNSMHSNNSNHNNNNTNIINNKKLDSGASTTLGQQQQSFPGPAAAAAVAAASIFTPLIDMSGTQTLLSLVKTAKENEIQEFMKKIKRPEVSSPLDLSSASTPPPLKRQRTTKHNTSSSSVRSSPNLSTPPMTIPKRPNSESPNLRIHEDISTWNVDDVASFVSGIENCAEYSQKFREQRIDGNGLPLLTEEHLMNIIGMKLGPALTLRSVLAKKTGSCNVCFHCSHCHNNNSTSNNHSPELIGGSGGNNSGSTSGGSGGGSISDSGGAS